MSGAVRASDPPAVSATAGSSRGVPLALPGAASDGKGAGAVIFGEPETPRFLAAVQRLKRHKQKQQQQARQARQRLRSVLRKLREC